MNTWHEGDDFQRALWEITEPTDEDGPFVRRLLDRFRETAGLLPPCVVGVRARGESLPGEPA